MNSPSLYPAPHHTVFHGMSRARTPGQGSWIAGLRSSLESGTQDEDASHELDRAQCGQGCRTRRSIVGCSPQHRLRGQQCQRIRAAVTRICTTARGSGCSLQVKQWEDAMPALSMDCTQCVPTSASSNLDCDASRIPLGTFR